MEKADTRSSINYKHLKPLSRYSKLITSEQKASQLYIPNMTFKIERMNCCDRKRKVDDSCLDESFQTPAKKAFQPQALSPDLGCFVDSPPEKQDPAGSHKIIVTVGSEPRLEQGQYGSADQGNKPLNRGSECENVRNGASYLEIDELWSLDPCGSKAERLPDNVSSAVEPLEGDVDEFWNIGLPILESSVCQSSNAALNAGGEQNRPASDEVQGGVMEPISECQATLYGEESSLDTSNETSLPLKVPVKSVVLVPSWRPLDSKPAPKCVTSFKSQRTVISDREVDLERDKQTYLHLVTRHVSENPGAGVMSELLNLMTDVAEQRQHSGAPRWQHPSDLTRRNYQKRFGNLTPSVSLQEWHSMQCRAQKRFANVPKLFPRSQLL